MKKTTRLLTAVASGLACLTMTAANPTPAIVIKGSTGESAYEINKVKNITFEGTTMKVDTGEATTSYDVLSLSGITFDFSGIPSGIDGISVGGDEVTLSMNGGVLTATAPDGIAVNLAVYSINGVTVRKASAMAQVDIDLNELPKGVYIIKANNKTFSYMR